MRISLRSLMLYIAAVSVALMLTQLDFVNSGYVLIAIIIAANLFLSKHTWRCVAYGALAGIIVSWLALQLFILADQGRLIATNYEESNAIFAIEEMWRSYVIHIGALVGGTLGLILFGKREKPDSATTPVEPIVEP